MPAQKRHKPLPPPAPEQSERLFTVAHLSGAALAQRLLSFERSKPAVVVSYKLDAGTRRLDAAALAQQLGEDAEVFEIANGQETLRLEEKLPPGLAIFGTGARVYPVARNLSSATFPRLVLDNTDLTRLTHQIIHDFQAAARSQSSLSNTTPTPTKPVEITATGTVTGFASADNSRARVKLATTGKIVMIRAEELLPGVPLSWLLTQGQLVTGALDAENDTLDITRLLLTQVSPLQAYGDGDVALARVKETCATYAVVSLWPGSDFQLEVKHISSNELDHAEDLLTEGEVVRVRVLHELGTVLLSMLDVDDDEPVVSAPPLVLGGSPWLDLDRPYASIFDPPANAPTAASVATATPHEPSKIPAECTCAKTNAAAAIEPALTPAERKTALKTTQMELEKARHTIAELLASASKHGATDKTARVLQDQLADARKESSSLARQLHEGKRQLESLRLELAKTKAKLVDSKQQRRSVASRSEPSVAGLFSSPEEQFGFELTMEWARRVPAVDKVDEPLGDYIIGPEFLDSLALLTSAQRAKALRAVVDLIAARQGPLHNRNPHFLRENEGAHAPARTRGEDICMRLAVEQGRAGALRLHYWKLKSGGLELHEVVSHDAVKP